MSAAELREAASKMRERAEGVAATEWFCTSSGEERYDGYDVWTHDGESPWTVATSDFAPTAEHIAGWHPLVALAVADLLSFAAEVWSEDDECRSPVGPDESCGECENCDHRWTRDRLVAVARAYLGGVR